jgi:hypothetical protein
LFGSLQGSLGSLFLLTIFQLLVFIVIEAYRKGDTMMTPTEKLTLVSTFDTVDNSGKDYIASLVAQDKGKRIRDISDDEVLQYHKDLVKQIFDTQCQIAIEAGFVSPTNNHIFRTNKDDQINIIGEYLLVKEDATITKVYWKTEDAGIVPIPRDDFMVVFREALTHKNNVIQAFWMKKVEVDACTSHAQINAIQWDYPTPDNTELPKQPQPTPTSPGEPVQPVVDISPPADVTDLTEAHTETSVSLTWTNPTDSDFSHVAIYRDDIQIGQSTNGLYEDVDLIQSATYVYNVVTVDQLGNQSAGIVQSVTLTVPVNNPNPDTTTDQTTTPDTTTDTTNTITETNTAPEEAPITQSSIGEPQIVSIESVRAATEEITSGKKNVFGFRKKRRR